MLFVKIFLNLFFVLQLVSGCRDPDSTAQSLFGECLGEMGAIDPGRLEIITSNKKEDLSKFHVRFYHIFFRWKMYDQIFIKVSWEYVISSGVCKWDHSFHFDRSVGEMTHLGELWGF